MVIRQVVKVPAWHPCDPKVKHRAVQRYKTDEECKPAGFGPGFVVHASVHLWEPVMECPEKCKSRSPEHDKVEMCHHKCSVVQVDIGRQRPQHQAAEPTDHEYKDKCSSPEERNIG